MQVYNIANWTQYFKVNITLMILWYYTIEDYPNNTMILI